MLSERDNLLNFYRHKPIDHFATYLQGARFLFEANGYLERPANKQSGKDWFDVPWIYDEPQLAFVPDHIQAPILEDICAWSDVVKWPELDAIDWEKAAREDGADVADKENLVYSVWDGCGPFERLHALMGFEGALIALITEPDEVEAFFERFTEYKVKLINYICKFYKPDVFQFQDDAGTNKSTFYSPDTWRNLIKPVWQAEIDAIHSNGVIAELHSCGNNTPIFLELGEMGLDCVFCQPINDLQAMRQAYKGNVAMMVQVDSNHYNSLAVSNSINEKQLRKMVYNEIKGNIESGYGHDYLPLAFPPTGIITEQNTSDVTLETIDGIIWDEIYKHADEFTSIIHKLQNG